jgi:hypothetical protein
MKKKYPEEYMYVDRETNKKIVEQVNLGDGAVPTLHPASPLVDGGEICVHVPGEPASARHLLPGS